MKRKSKANTQLHKKENEKNSTNKKLHTHRERAWQDVWYTLVGPSKTRDSIVSFRWVIRRRQSSFDWFSSQISSGVDLIYHHRRRQKEQGKTWITIKYHFLRTSITCLMKINDSRQRVAKRKSWRHSIEDKEKKAHRSVSWSAFLRGIEGNHCFHLITCQRSRSNNERISSSFVFLFCSNVYFHRRRRYSASKTDILQSTLLMWVEKANNLDDDIQSEQQLHLVVSEKERKRANNVICIVGTRVSSVDDFSRFQIAWRDNERELEDPTRQPVIHPSINLSLSIQPSVLPSSPPVSYFLAIEVCCNSLFAYEGRLHSFACMCVVRRKEQAIVMSSRKRNWINYDVREHSSLSLVRSLACFRSVACKCANTCTQTVEREDNELEQKKQVIWKSSSSSSSLSLLLPIVQNEHDYMPHTSKSTCYYGYIARAHDAFCIIIISIVAAAASSSSTTAFSSLPSSSSSFSSSSRAVYPRNDGSDTEKRWEEERKRWRIGKKEWRGVSASLPFFLLLLLLLLLVGSALFPKK